MLNETQYELTYTKCVGAAIDTIWQILNPSHNSWTGFKSLGLEDFLKRREAFLWILEQLIKQSRIKLHKKGVFLESPIDEQIAPFRRAFPKNEKDAHQIVFNTDETQCRPSTAIGLWFFLDDCPAGIAWRREDGSYEIAD